MRGLSAPRTLLAPARGRRPGPAGGRDGWAPPVQNAYAIHNVLAMRPELPFFLIRWDGKRGLSWMDLGDPRQRLQPYHFEIFYGRKPLRDQHHLDALARAQRSHKVVLRELLGFWDLFYAVPGDPERRTFLYAGQFCRAQPEWATLGAQWQALTGQQAASADADFVRFVRMALSVPVLEAPLCQAIEQFVELYALYLGGGSHRAELKQRVDRLNRERISRLWPIEDWIASVLSPDKLHLAPWNLSGQLTPWMKEGMGIDRLPTTALALMPVDSPRRALDPVQALVRNAQVQRACLELARELPETAAIRLGDLGVSIITSTGERRGGERARAELCERAQRFRERVAAQLDVRTIVGIGATLTPGAPLYPSHRDALRALHQCVREGEDVRFHDEAGEEPLRYADLHRAAGKLVAAFEHESGTEIQLARERYVRLVVRFASDRIEVVRSQFLAALYQVLAVVQRSYPMPEEAHERLAGGLSLELEEARSLVQVIGGFDAALRRLSLVASPATDGPAVLRLEATLLHLREHFADPLPLPEVARRAGLSLAAFSRVFRKATGTSFLAYLRAIRVAHAKQLLLTTPLGSERIAHACGFHSLHHLMRAFKKLTGATPGAFRRAHGQAAGDERTWNPGTVAS